MKRIAALALIAALGATSVAAEEVKPVTSSQSLILGGLGGLGAGAIAAIAVVTVSIVAVAIDNASGT